MTFVAVLAVVFWVVTAVAPGLVSTLAFIPAGVATGQVWRLVTWPWAAGASLFGALNLFFFWYFGNDLEREIGRRRMAGLLVGTWAAVTVAYFVAALLTGDQVALAGLGLVQFLLLLVWIADNPRRPFFFGIPAWVVGAVLVGVQVLSYVAGRAWAYLLASVLAAALVAVLARRAGLLAGFSRLPGRGAARRPQPRPPPDAPPARPQRRRAADAARLDELLDKISSEGIHSLSPGERKELDQLRQRRRS